MKITANTVVTIDFEMTNQDGQLIDSTKEDALIYLHGHENIMPELENGLNGLEAGNDFEVVLSPEKAFGEKEEGKVFTVPKTEFEAPKLEVGMQFQTVDEENNPVIATIVDLKDDDVVIDENHPLAGMTLTFKGQVKEIREATEEELSHGHIHADGGSCGSGHSHDHEHDDCCNH
ncbi:MAG: peptidylprolyl isomerase [Lentisphaeraceae bacterium]|nr:peptidylprolyl isomerase [Lentisphaeraceae bacterium]